MYDNYCKNFYLVKDTQSILEGICRQENINVSALLKLLIKAWRFNAIFIDKFPDLTTWKKTQFTAMIVKGELDKQKKLDKSQ